MLLSTSGKFLAKWVRRKKACGDEVLSTNLRRCLSMMDVAFFGIGNMLGSGVYVLSPTVARDETGPAIVLSFLLAGVASLLAALAYAEFGVRFPRAGSAYSYTYFALGEILAFFVGWNLVMENVLALAAIGRSCSAYADSLLGGVIKNVTIGAIGKMEESDYLSEYPDIFAAILLTAFLVFMMLGAKETSLLNNTLVVVNVSVMAIILGTGGYFASVDNWRFVAQRGDPKPEGFINGFLPYGWKGVFSACAKCFFAYVGFDGIAAAGEEAKDPRKAIPAATLITMFIVSGLYISVSAVITLMLPYYEITRDSGIPDALGHVGAHWARYLVSVGAMASMVTVIIGTIFAVSRVMYAMAEDGLLPATFHATVRQVPAASMLLCTFIAAVIAVLFDVDAIIEMLSIGTLFAYFVVAFGVLVVRHADPRSSSGQNSSTETCDANAFNIAVSHQGGKSGVSLHPGPGSLLSGLYPPQITQKKLVIVTLCVCTVAVFSFGFAVNSETDSWPKNTVTIISGLAIIASALYLTPLQELRKDENYKMPFAPFLPILSMTLNAFLMTTMSRVTWIRFLGWLVLGLFAYVVHGMRHSKLNQLRTSAAT